MASVEEEELAMAVEGSGVHGNPLFRKELSYFLIALPAAQHGGTEEDSLSHFGRIQAFHEIFHMAVNVAFVNAASDKRRSTFLSSPLSVVSARSPASRAMAFATFSVAPPRL